VNSLVPSGTAPHVPSGTVSSCHRGPKSGEKASGSETWRGRNFSNKESFGFLLTEASNWGRPERTPSDRLPIRDNSPRRALVRALTPVGRANAVSATLGGIAWSASGHSQSDYRPSACLMRLSISAGTPMIVALLNQGGVGKTTLALISQVNGPVRANASS
jgi:hypothetical protein